MTAGLVMVMTEGLEVLIRAELLVMQNLDARKETSEFTNTMNKCVSKLYILYLSIYVQNTKSYGISSSRLLTPPHFLQRTAFCVLIPLPLIDINHRFLCF